MKEDRLEQFIKENRAAFGDAEAPFGHFGRFDTKLSGLAGEKSKDLPVRGKKNLTWIGSVVATAACIVLIAGFGIGRVTSDGSISDFKPVQEKNSAFSLAGFSEMEAASDEAIDQKIGNIKLQVNDHNSGYISQAIADYQTMMREYESLKSEYKRTGNRRIGTAIVQNVQSREAFLDQILGTLNERNNNNVYNTSYQTTAGFSTEHGECCGFFKANNGLPVHGGEILFGELRSK